MDQEKLVTSLNHYLNLLLTTSALFMAPCTLIVSRDFPAHTEPYPGFFICLYLALYLTILSFFATILLGLLTMKNLDYLNLTDKKPTQNMLSNTAKLFNITRIFYRYKRLCCTKNSEGTLCFMPWISVDLFYFIGLGSS